jgi:hypothetical protein
MIKEPGDRLVLTELHRDEKTVRIAFIIISVLFVVLLAIVSYLIFLYSRGQKPVPDTTQELPSASASLTPTSTPTPSPTVTPIQPQTQTNVTNEPSIKDYYVPFGTGTNQTSDWADVPGMQAVIDFGNYKNIKEVYFEVNVNVPTGNEMVWVRLYNITDKHPVWYSEVTTTNNNYVFSPSLIYDVGTKVYQVQMKTQLQYPANLTLARIHIILK